MSKKYIAILTVFISLIIYQVSKIYVKLNMKIGDDIPYIGNWARIHFVENEGMAFGMSFGEGMGKFLLTIFRIIAVGFISYYLVQQVKNKKASKGFIFALSLILTGAVGNIIDSIFYGQLFSESTPTQLATFLPEQGYANFFHGKVVDMFYFPMYGSILPKWIPFIGGKYYEFFQYIFNIADACITVGVSILLVFQKQFFKEDAHIETIQTSTSESSSTSSN
ncbi:MAG TPA: lipoprotein signal peptidase [Chitinophagales bacterium]|nr:lipoprotein signal peptidase [Chitinophagales bacterium]